MSKAEIYPGFQDRETRTGEKGAFENGQRLDVVGRKLKVGEKAPDFSLLKVDPGSDETALVSLSQMPDKYLLYLVNSFGTPVCASEARQCEDISKTLRDNGDVIPIFGVSNDDPSFLRDWMKEDGITNPILSVPKDNNFGPNYGVLIPAYDGQLQRSLFGIVSGKLVYTEYVYDQGELLPNFVAAVRAIFMEQA
ncbi:MAG: redoxin family protein [Candidatus Levybacteria bacterium]|nr:redoxin family protein [Candidatus Levybacteria bacterium]